MHPSKRLSLLLFLSLAAVPTPALADCAEGDGYDGTVSGSSVQIRVFGDQSPTCPQPGGMLRQDTATGAIVKLADFCAPADSGPAYVDECVPPGTYRYGFATPYTCDSAACGGTPYYTEVTVPDALSPSCTPSTGDPGPTPATAVPWKNSSLVCNSSEGAGGSGAGGSGGSGAGGGSSSGSSGGGCSIGLSPRAAPVLGANLLALAAGLTLMRRARGKQR